MPSLSERRARRLTRGFRVVWFGDGVSLLGTATTAVLLPLLAVVHLHAGPEWMGAITAAAWLPWLVVGLPVGAWVDRLSARAVLIAANLASAFGVGSVPVAWWLGMLRLPQLVVVAVVVGTASVFRTTAGVKLVPQLVSSADLEAANARLFGTESAAQVGGPGLAAALTAVVSAATGLLVDVASYLVSVCCLLRIRPARSRPPATRESLGVQIRAGLRVVFRDRNLGPMTVIGGASNIGLTGYAAILVVHLVDRLGLSPTAVSVLLMTASAGGVAGAAMAPRLARRVGSARASVTLMIVSGLAGLLIAVPTGREGAVIVAVGQLLVVAGCVGGNVLRGSWRQRYVPAPLMGRVMASSQLVNFAGMPVAALGAGILAAHAGTRTTILVMTGINAVACVGALTTRIGRMRDFPSPKARP